jgi:hypothetical protein
VAGAPPMAVALADKFSAKIAALRKSDPIIDWSAVPSGRVAKFLSEVLAISGETGAPGSKPSLPDRWPLGASGLATSSGHHRRRSVKSRHAIRIQEGVKSLGCRTFLPN